MYSNQNGLLAWTTKIVGLAILVYSIGVGLIEAIANLITNHMPIDFLVTVIGFIVVLLFPLWIGLLLVKMFPSVRVVRDGIKYFSIGWLKGIIKWNEIDEVLLFENGYTVIAFERPGLFLINGTYFNKLYGILIRHESPVLYLSPNTSNLEEILNAIYQNSKVKSMKKVARKR